MQLLPAGEVALAAVLLAAAIVAYSCASLAAADPATNLHASASV
jgi:hypothetical protein